MTAKVHFHILSISLRTNPFWRRNFTWHRHPHSDFRVLDSIIQSCLIPASTCVSATPQYRLICMSQLRSKLLNHGMTKLATSCYHITTLRDRLLNTRNHPQTNSTTLVSSPEKKILTQISVLTSYPLRRIRWEPS
jgi:hypothetical protein